MLHDDVDGFDGELDEGEEAGFDDGPMIELGSEGGKEVEETGKE